MKSEEEHLTELDKQDFEYRYKKRLFGNLKFIAELFKKRLVSSNIPLIVMNQLCGITSKEVNEFTIEGACTLLAKVGEKLDKAEKLKQQKLEEESPTKDKKKMKNKDKGSSLEKNQERFEEILKKMGMLLVDEKIDKRVRYIIQNTLSLRETGWIDKDLIDGPKTKKQIKRDHEASLRGEEDVKMIKSKSTMNKKYSSGKGMFADLSLSKMESTTSIISEMEEDEGIPKPVEKHYSPRELEHMDHEAIKDRFIGNFVEWSATGEFSLDMFHKEENKCSEDHIVEFLLDKLYDKTEDEVQKFDEYFFGLYNKKLFSKKGIEKGISRFFVTIPDIEADFPHLPKLFGHLLYFIFVEKNIADFKKVEITLVGDNEDLAEDEEPMYFIDIYFKILSFLLSKVEEDLGVERLDYYYQQFNIEKTAKLLRPHILEEGLFSEIKEELKTSEKVISLLDVSV